MIEHLNGIALVLLPIITALGLMRRKELNLDNISERIAFVKDVLEFIGKLPSWAEYCNDLIANVQYLRDRRARLETRMDDLSMRVEEEEFRTCRQRKREVDNWLTSAATKDTEVRELLDQIDSIRGTYLLSRFLYRAWWGSQAQRKIKEVDELYDLGVFKEVLSPTREKLERVVRPLVGKAADENIREIMRLSRPESGITTIGVHGVKGIGKTEIMNHIHNQLLRNGNSRIYMVEAPEDSTEYNLQKCIANVLGLDLQEEDVNKRAALLNRALRRGKFVLILDGLKKYFAVEDVGIPLDAMQGKLIITSRSPVVCRRMGCQETVAVEPLPSDDALELFKRKVELGSSFQPPIEGVAIEIVRNCLGVPSRIIAEAIHMRREHDISVWETYLNEITYEGA
uniref:RPS5-like protein n=1 Tax=Sesuvium portulacastrum TaxID=221166 RepID=A0A2I7ZAU1_SESPO|nr:RPS5-like protein [Sesuvium portulacastrum]